MAGLARLDVVKVGISPNYPFTARAVPLLGQVLPHAMPGIRLHILVFQKYPEIRMALLRIDLVGMLLAEGNNRRCTDPWSPSGLLRIPLLVNRFAEQTLLKPQSYDCVTDAQQSGYPMQRVLLRSAQFRAATLFDIICCTAFALRFSFRAILPSGFSPVFHSK